MRWSYAVRSNLPFVAALAAVLLVALALRLVVWRWHEFYPLGGDEREYLNQALIMLRERRYEELRLMRPPLYPLALALAIRAVDSLVQNLRLLQALLSAATVALFAWLGYELNEGDGAAHARRAALLTALLAALSYSLAANASELLSETLFLAGLTLSFALLVRAGRVGTAASSALAGFALGASCLVRSVALPLLPLGALGLFGARYRPGRWPWRWPTLFLLCATLVIAPWSARNYVTYGGLIIIDTTGAENLWLDNDPAGREAVKAQLYALGDDRYGRQQLAASRGMAAILADPARFAAKAAAELPKFFALEYSDAMLVQRAIWLPPAEVAARLALGDGLWLFVLLLGSYGLARAVKQRTSDFKLQTSLFIIWALYTLFTALLFHVELRYRLPLYPVLLPYAARELAVLQERLARAGQRGMAAPPAPDLSPVRGRVGHSAEAEHARAAHMPRAAGRSSLSEQKRAPRADLACILIPLLLVVLTLAQRNYATLAWQLGWKHVHLARAEAALAQKDAATARSEATAALVRDTSSALARVALARAALLQGDETAAETELRAAIAALPAHPHAHLLRGDLLRRRGADEAARSELAYETGSLQDLQGWLWERALTPPSPRLELGDGLDLGFVRGFHAAVAAEPGLRWTKGDGELRLHTPPAAIALRLRLASGRPAPSAPLAVELFVAGQRSETLAVAAGWAEYRVALPAGLAPGELRLALRSPTFTPRDYDRASADGRELGVMVDWVASEVGP